MYKIRQQIKYKASDEIKRWNLSKWPTESNIVNFSLKIVALKAF